MTIDEMIPKLIRAGLENDMKSFEIISLTIANKLKTRNKDVSEEIINVLSYKNMGNSAFRAIGFKDTPVNNKNNTSLANIEEVIEIEEPVLNDVVKKQYEKFLEERENIDKLIKHGMKADNTILVYGAPGVGKTYSAKWLSYKLNKPLVNLDLSSVISSYLGETGSNLKSVLDYAKEVNGILFLDEFDAIAKKRDDSRDIGELKRIVNVLLKELENWPSSSIVIAATNHPELLDRAIWRRFDIKINIPMPDIEIREKIIIKELGDLKIPSKSIYFISKMTSGISSAEIVRLCKNIKKTHILKQKKLDECILENLKISTEKFKSFEKVEICKKIKEIWPSISASEIQKITSIPVSSIYKYLKK
ncbi:AAA family ATPase [Clostridioides difficile]|uniref:AAA family ATPase n=1 Tax=Clostridioides difficile TaxID=1496 RepID=UPI00097FE317|nr:ATP-binding protein [Clostridioides difficile]SJP21948.1 ATP-dependent zinc metalloprotease FtsH [Clostridioides difficile]